MAITVVEKPESRRITDDESVELIYLITGTASEADALTALKAEAPATHDGMTRGKCSVEPIPESIDSGDADFCKWEGTAPYAPPSYTKIEPPETGESSFSFDIGGGTQHITQAIANVGNYAPTGKTAPDFKGAIGVTTDSVVGADILMPTYNFTETHYLSAATVTNAYKAILFALYAKTNTAPFKGCAVGECIFCGASGSKRGAGDWEITFRFAGSPNKTNITIADITVASKKGWEYLWVRYDDVDDSAAKKLVKRPTSAHVEQVYYAGDYSALGIGT